MGHDSKNDDRPYRSSQFDPCDRTMPEVGDVDDESGTPTSDERDLAAREVEEMFGAAEAERG